MCTIGDKRNGNNDLLVFKCSLNVKHRFRGFVIMNNLSISQFNFKSFKKQDSTDYDSLKSELQYVKLLKIQPLDKF